MEDRKRAHVYVSGRVQGVFFRDSARQRAQELGVSGWVKNTPDGRLESVFEGDPSSVEEMIEWFGKGPSHASVEEVETSYEKSRGDLSRFEVL